MITARRQLELETFFLIAAAAAVSIFLVIYKNDDLQAQLRIITGIPTIQVPIEIIAPKVFVSSQISPDGEKKVILKATQDADSTTYEIYTADENNANEKLIFTKILDSSSSMAVPFNTWSPDNKYFFIEQNEGGKKSVFVFEARGVQFANEAIYLDATEAFEKQNTGSNFDKATGWASETLIIINTKKQDGEKGFSYWFEVPSKAIIQLATDF